MVTDGRPYKGGYRTVYPYPQLNRTVSYPVPYLTYLGSKT